MPASSHVFDRITVTFDDDHAVANAGLILPATLLDHLGVEEAADAMVSVGYRPGRKVATVVHGILAGAECIDDLGVLRAGATDRVLPTKVMAPSTVGTWLREFTFGHVRQLDKLSEQLLTRAWASGAGPGAAPMTIDVDSRSAKSTGIRSRARPTATPASSATTRSWRRERTPVRCSTLGCARGRRTRCAAHSGSSARPSGASAAPARPAR